MSKPDPKIQKLQTQLLADGFDPGPVDGLDGPRTQLATSRRAMLEDRPPSSPWPDQNRAALEAFYGRFQLGDDGRPTERWENQFLTQIKTPFPMRLAWEPTTIVRKITCHRAVARSLSDVLDAILAHYGTPDAIREAGLDLYGGCYNYRVKRGGSTLSMHAYGAAIDLDPDHNAFGAKWQDGTGMMPPEVVQIFQQAGWTWGGHWSKPDPMHFQAANI